MANRWLFLLIGIALTQGSLALSSPLTTLDEEWANFNEILRDPAYRLPTTTVPRHYAVTLAPYFDNVEADLQFTFDGEVNIYISPTEENVNEIVIHCNDLTIESVSVLFGSVEITTAGQTYACEMPYSFLRIPTTQALQLNQEYVVSITFRGNLQTNMRGFYRSWYDDSTGRRWMGTTQFQPGHARQAFPCYDEPGFKATFDISIVRDSDFSPTISNMPIASSGASGTRVIDNFHTTPRTSTYLLAFIVSHYDEVATNNNNTRPFSIYARDNVGETGEWSLEIGELLLDAMERYTGYDYYTMADNMNMKQAAIPDFSAGAMENWGLLTYREALILYDPLNSNHFYKQRVANIVSHEIAHMWFGNLVTCAWWDNLWLNEGFARFYQYYLTGSVAPDLGYEIRFIVEQVQTAMFSDSIDSAHALTNPNVNDPTTVSAHFSTITYAKGAAVLRMTQHLLGEDTYVKALRSYISQRAFDVAEPHHLFEALDAAAAEDNALANYNGITIDEYFRTWSEKGGHPLLTVTVDQRTGRMVVYQARWERNTGVSSIPSVWHVPITWTRAGDPDFEDLKPSQIITAQATTVDRGTIGNEWVIFNKQETGFYRVNYDVTNWALITLALRSENRTVIHELNRAQIVDDLFALARANVLPYQRIMNVLSFLEYEDAYAPWIAAISGFNFVLRRLAHDEDNLQKLKDEIIRLSAAVTARLGYAEIEDEPYMDGLLRLYVMEFLCDIGHEECVSAGVASFQGWTNGGFVPANMRPWVYCVGLRNGNAANFTYFWNRYLQEDLANEAVVMLQKAGCTTDQASLEIFLNAITDGQDTVRAQDAATAWNAALVGNEENTMRVFYWLQNNLEASIATFGAAPVNALAQRLLNEEQIAEFQEWLDANQETLGSAYNTGVNAIAIARENLAWSGTRMPELYAYLETGYVEDVIDDIIDVEEETVPEPEPVPDSANLAALGFVSLLAVAIVNFVA